MSTFHRVDTSELGADDGVSVGGCCNHDEKHQIEYAGLEPLRFTDLLIVSAIILILAYIAFLPEFSGFLMVIREEFK
jgi:hypothetical protein